MTETPQTIFFAALGAPFESDSTTTLFRLIDAALARQHTVIVWTCGGATTLTLQTLGDRRPRNFLNFDAEYPSTAKLVRALLDGSDGRLHWHICRHCMEERGATEQIEGVKIQPPFRFFHFLEQADASLVIGPK